MQMPLPLTRDVLLIGGGHAHALVLRAWGMDPMPGVRLTVVNPGPTAPYTGMLPGHVAGHYGRADLDIDLVRLARFAGARLLNASVTRIDPDQKTALTDQGALLSYDIASIDIGITAEMPMIPGFMDHGVGAKPLATFANRWRGFLAQTDGTAVTAAVIGGGVAGCELALAMGYALKDRAPGSTITVIEAASELTGMGQTALHKVKAAMQELNVQRVTNATVVEIKPDQVVLADGAAIGSTFSVGAAGAMPWPWLKDTPLPLKDGFITVRPDLRVQGYDNLFAVGDCAHMPHAPRPKAGVFAVRAAPVLTQNLRALAMGTPLKSFKPQKHYLKLISLGRQSALAEKFGYSIAAPLLWRWKDQIDRSFMKRLSDLPSMPRPQVPGHVAKDVRKIVQGKPLCGGCGSKIGGDVLRDTLAMLTHVPRDDVLSAPGDDAAILRWDQGRQQVLTTDHLRAFSLDPVVHAEITAIHALGDIWAMGATPQAALVNVTLPPMSEPLQTRTMADIMGALSKVCAAEGAPIVGGHSTIGPELSIGLTFTGLTAAAPILQSGAQGGDALILTRPLGSGTLLAAEMAMQAEGADVVAMLRKMRMPQSDAARILAGAHAMTDVTGFGLAGHVWGICRASGVCAHLRWDDIPLYEGAGALAMAGVRSSLYAANAAAAPVKDVGEGAKVLLHDPQTAGGLLASVDPKAADHLVNALRAAGHDAAIIGSVLKGPPAVVCR